MAEQIGFPAEAEVDNLTRMLLDGMRIADTREEFDTMRYELLKTGWVQKKLLFGDFAFCTCEKRKVGITRKTWSDLCKSIGETFAFQLDQMLEYYDICRILIEGKPQRDPATDKILVYTPDKIRGFTYESVMLWVSAWQDRGFRLDFTFSTEHTIQWLNQLYANYQKPYSLSSKSRKWKDDRILAFPSGCRGMYEQAVIDEMSLAEASQMTAEEWQVYKGIGVKKAQAIYNRFHYKPNKDYELKELAEKAQLL